MQLDLFLDTRSTILHNEAVRSLRELDLERACAIYAELLADAPGDKEILSLKVEAERWRESLTRLASADPQELHELYSLLGEKTSPALRDGVLTYLIEQLLAFPEPEVIYIPPRFHLGCLLQAAGRYAEAEQWFAAALQSGVMPPGRFLAWYGDAVTLTTNGAAAMEFYQAAFLEDPEAVDIGSITNGTIRTTLVSMCNECIDEEVDDRELIPWLPFWGWFNGLFSLDLNSVILDREIFVATLQQSDDSGNLSLPRLWYEYLRFAEYLRTCRRDDRELVRVRRRMKQLNANMFDRYMEKIGGAQRNAAR